jgi:hypothetical protein
MKTSLIVAGVIVAVGSAGAWVALRDPGRGRVQDRASPEYPTAGPKVPSSIEFKYDGASDRTRMVLTLKNMEVKARSGFGAADTRLVITSSYEGSARAPDRHETSVSCKLSAKVAAPGLFSYVGSLGELTADGRAVPVREDVKKGEEAGQPIQSSGGVETVRFKLDTEDLLALASAGSVAGRFGAMEFSLTASNLKDLREFAAQMNPNP